MIPAILIVSSDFIANSESQSHAPEIQKSEIYRSVFIAPNAAGESAEEFESAHTSQANLIVDFVRMMINPNVLSNEHLDNSSSLYLTYGIGIALNSRPPPAL